MIVDGICIQFFGCFEHGLKTDKSLDNFTQQINGVGRVELDENYYRTLSSTQVLNENSFKSEDNDYKQTNIVQPVIAHKTRQQTAKLKNRSDTILLTNKPKTRSRTISENIPLKTQATSPPPPTVSTSKHRINSPTHMPYPLRSPRTKQHRISSPVHQPPSGISRDKSFHSINSFFLQKCNHLSIHLKSLAYNFSHKILFNLRCQYKFLRHRILIHSFHHRHYLN